MPPPKRFKKTEADRGLEMPKHRKSAMAAAAILIVAHLILLTFRYGTAFASLWGDWIGSAALFLAAGCLLVRLPPIRFLWQAGLAPDFFFACSRLHRPDRFYLLFRLSARYRNALDYRHPGVFLGCARHDDAVSESARPEQRIPVVAVLRFCASLHSRTLSLIHI